MTKTKKQLRAEAVERLKEYHDWEAHQKSLANITLAIWPMSVDMSNDKRVDALIDLLTDDDANDDSTPGKVVRTASVDANDVKVSTMPLKVPSEIRWHYTDGGEYTQELTGDSRDKIEADARKIADAYNMDTQRHGSERFAHELYYSIIHLLNRQRAIDDSICDECSSDYYDMQEEHDQMIDGIAKLMRLKQPYTFDNDKPLENIETIGRYIDELTSERDELQEQLLIGWECECRLQAEREHYREKFGKCIDYADAIHALMDDEGLA